MSCAKDKVTPALSATPWDVASGPAATSSASAWPCYPPWNLIILSRPVWAHASLSALIAASVPELTDRANETEGYA